MHLQFRNTISEAIVFEMPLQVAGRFLTLARKQNQIVVLRDE